MFVWAILLDVDFVEQRLDVCPVPNDADGSENESDDRSVVVVVELHLMEEDDLEWVEMTGIGGRAGVGGWLMLRSWFLSTKACMLDSTVFFICCIISSALKDALGPGGVD